MSSPCEWAVNIPKRKLSAHFEFIDSFKKIKNVLFIFFEWGFEHFYCRGL